MREEMTVLLQKRRMEMREEMTPEEKREEEEMTPKEMTREEKMPEEKMLEERATVLLEMRGRARNQRSHQQR